MAPTGDSLASSAIPSEAIVAAPSAAEAVPQPVTTPSRWHFPWTGLRWSLLMMLVPALAFLLAAFPARNSDAWLHLAAGKMLARGEVRFGDDPFSFTTNNVTWVNHAWLSDLIGYSVYLVGQGTTLVLLKALLIAGVGGLLLALGWTRNSPTISAACAFLALAAIGQGIPLDPICISCLFLALTLWLLERARQPKAVPTTRPFLRYVPVLILCALWVNLDAWFILGPLTIGLYLVGEWLQGRWVQSPMDRGQPSAAPRNPTLAVLGLVLAASLAVCLLNPYHIRAFALPPPLSFLTLPTEFQADPTLSRFLFQSPVQSEYLNGIGSSVPGVAYYLLAVVSLVSFQGSAKPFPFTWALLWAVFFTLSVFHATLIPFFAIVAGPCLARNLSGNPLSKSATGNPKSETNSAFFGFRISDFGSAGEGLVALAGAVLLVLAWPGWLQTQPFQRRSLELVSDPALESAARQILDWREQGLLARDHHTFNFGIETAPYLAWLGTSGNREKYFLDIHFQIFPPAVLRDFVRIRKALDADKTNDPELQALLRENKIDRLLLSDRNLVGFEKKLVTLQHNPSWALLGLEGRTAVLAWRDPKAARGSEAWASLARTPEQQAFYPFPAKQAPTAGPERFPRLPSWSSPFVEKRVVRDPDRDEAAIHLYQFDDSRKTYALGQQQIVETSLRAALVGLAVPNGTALGPVPGALLGTAVLDIRGGDRSEQPPRFVLGWQGWARNGLAFQLSEGAPSALWQALRASRRAIKANPDDGQAWLQLGECYFLLLYNTSERALTLRLPQFANLRRVQAVTALRQGLHLAPNTPVAHLHLAMLYRDLRCIDLYVKHLKEHFRLLREKLTAVPDETEPQFKERVADLERKERSLAELDDKVNTARAKLTQAFDSNKKVVDRARLALQEGMGGLALEVLMASDLAAFGPAGMGLELELLLITGRAKDLKEWNDPELQIKELGGTYFLLQAQLDAALGDYEQADKNLRALFPRARLLQGLSTPVQHRPLIGLTLAQALLREAPGPRLPWDRSLRDLYFEMQNLSNELRNQADLEVYRALLALEVGRTEYVEESLRRTLRLWDSAGAGSQGRLDFSARPLAQYYLQQIEASKPASR